jgi:hypothetical protein
MFVSCEQIKLSSVLNERDGHTRYMGLGLTLDYGPK